MTNSSTQAPSADPDASRPRNSTSLAPAGPGLAPRPRAGPGPSLAPPPPGGARPFALLTAPCVAMSDLLPQIAGYPFTWRHASGLALGPPGLITLLAGPRRPNSA